ncbi:hypothetical protein F5051DRAFT_447136 [Lentinula edodes]|nr:hypothetical protein F5051DRAFT_447136 [Lentinula edodes]
MSYRVYMPVILEELGFKVTERWFDEVEPHAGEAGFISNPRARCLDCNSWSARHHRLACRYTANLDTTPNSFTKKETLLEADEPDTVVYWPTTRNSSSPTSSSAFFHRRSFIPPLFTHQHATSQASPMLLSKTTMSHQERERWDPMRNRRDCERESSSRLELHSGFTTSFISTNGGIKSLKRTTCIHKGSIILCYDHEPNTATKTLPSLLRRGGDVYSLISLLPDSHYRHLQSHLHSYQPDNNTFCDPPRPTPLSARPYAQSACPATSSPSESQMSKAEGGGRGGEFSRGAGEHQGGRKGGGRGGFGGGRNAMIIRHPKTPNPSDDFPASISLVVSSWWRINGELGLVTPRSYCVGNERKRIGG